MIFICYTLAFLTGWVVAESEVQRVKNVTNFILFLDVTTGRFQKTKPTISGSYFVQISPTYLHIGELRKSYHIIISVDFEPTL